MTHHDDPFFDVPTTLLSTSEGDVRVPACYYDSSNYVALFRADAARATQKLIDLPVQPLLVSRKAVVVLSFFKYRETSLGPYHEVGLALLVTPGDRQQELRSFNELIEESARGELGSWVLDLPVSTPLAKAAGCELWGYPKFVTELPIGLDGDQLDARVLDPDGGLIMELSGQRGHALPEELPGMALLTYSMHEGKLLRTTVQTRAQCATSGGGSMRLVVGDSPHRMAGNLRDLGLDNRSPKLFQTTELFQSVLYPGEPM